MGEPKAYHLWAIKAIRSFSNICPVTRRPILTPRVSHILIAKADHRYQSLPPYIRREIEIELGHLLSFLHPSCLMIRVVQFTNHKSNATNADNTVINKGNVSCGAQLAGIADISKWIVFGRTGTPSAASASDLDTPKRIAMIGHMGNPKSSVRRADKADMSRIVLSSNIGAASADDLNRSECTVCTNVSCHFTSTHCGSKSHT
jgi:hypothetical protein